MSVSPRTEPCPPGSGGRRVRPAFELLLLVPLLFLAMVDGSVAQVPPDASWRTLETVAVLGAWAVAGVVIAPVVLRRMARRQSGSQVEAAREQAMQWVR